MTCPLAARPHCITYSLVGVDSHSTGVHTGLVSTCIQNIHLYNLELHVIDPPILLNLFSFESREKIVQRIGVDILCVEKYIIDSISPNLYSCESRVYIFGEYILRVEVCMDFLQYLVGECETGMVKTF